MPYHITFVLFPDVTQLDLTGPAQVLSRLPDCATAYAAATLDPVVTDCGFAIVPTVRLRDIERTDLICVPGGGGVVDALLDPGVVCEVRRLARSARYVTSVCTGTLLLGAAGLLVGKRATTHFAYHDLLPLAGAIPVRERVVCDGNTVTGGGVTAGIDFALTVAAEIADEITARMIATAIEYDPAPPFGPGTPAAQPREVNAVLGRRFQSRISAARRALTTVTTAQ